MTHSAIVLAGSRPGRDAFAASFGTDLKALIPVGGEPMVRRPVRALLASGSIGKVLVLSQAPDRLAAVLPEDPRLSVGRSDGTIAETLLTLIDSGEVEWPLLVTTGDHALLEPAMIDEFCNAASDSDVALGVVERATLMQRFPGAKRTWIKFRGGACTGANLFALRSAEVAPAIELWRSAEQGRKKGWRVLMLFGPLILLGAGLRLLSLDQVLARVGRRLGLKVKAVRLSNPLAGIDVDKAADHALVTEILEGRA
ncbi:MAG: NTP transferase domain-containing protein [Pseudomonadota bacterium]